MKTARLALCSIAIAAALAACEEKIDVPMDGADSTQAEAATDAPSDASPATASQNPNGSQPETAIQPTMIDADAVHVGKALDARGAATGGTGFAIGDTVHASLATAGRTGTAKVYWSDSTGIAIKEQEKPLSGDFVEFGFSRADGMKPGNYTVEIDVDGVPAGIADFTVR